jgi:hypothetical protein
VRDVRDKASYKQGQEVLLLLSSPSSAGFSSPMGLEQGRFRILRDRLGNEVAINGHANSGLFDGLSVHFSQKNVRLSERLAARIAQPPDGPLPLGELMDLIRELAGSN